MTHKKKILPQYFEQIASGQKTYELRLADWACQPGDTLVLEEWDKEKKVYTGRSITKKVGWVGKTKNIDLFPPEDVERYGYQIISLLD